MSHPLKSITARLQASPTSVTAALKENGAGIYKLTGKFQIAPEVPYSKP